MAWLPVAVTQAPAALAEGEIPPVVSGPIVPVEPGPLGPGPGLPGPGLLGLGPGPGLPGPLGSEVPECRCQSPGPVGPGPVSVGPLEFGPF